MAKLHQTGYIACLMMAVWVVVLHEPVLRVKAYTPVWTVSRSDVRSVTLQRSAVSFGPTDDSEWYSPPPAPKTAVVPRPSASKPLQTDVTTAQELARVLNDADNRLIIIKFYASWCKSCAKVSLKMDQLASEHADWFTESTETGAATKKITKLGNVRIFNVEYGAARDLCVEQEIHQLPTIHMYTMDRSLTRRGMRTKVQDFACPPREFQRVRDLTKGYILQHQSEKLVTTSGGKGFEAKLDAGHDLIQSSLLNEETIAFASSSEDLTIASSLVQDSKSSRMLPRLWRRLRP